MSSFAANRREERLNAVYSVSELITEQKYNIVLCGAVLWGLIINFILCITVGNVYEYINPIPFFIGYFVLVIAGSLIASKSDNAMVSFIGYNMIVLPIGLVVSTVVELYGGVQSTVVAEAFLITMCVTAVMALFAVTKPDLVATIGGILFPCLIGLIIAEVVVLLLGYNNNIFSWIGAALFSLYIAYDIYRSQQFTKTVDNAVDCAVDIYLDITNLFLRILRIVANSDD
ncbi:MAG: US12 family protein [Lachnospiraceae bacterium]|nr:US12 family protein [Lachnospiraceae bacterium]MBO4670010.1 US12 family protein [Lachnospiraceae bacterium]